jgi:hypothetical protein
MIVREDRFDRLEALVLELAADLRALTAQVTATSASVAALDVQVKSTNENVAALERAAASTNASVADLERISRRHERDRAPLRGFRIESLARAHPRGIFRALGLDDLRILADDELDRLSRAALSPDERDDLALADLVLRGALRGTGEATYVVAEISSVIDRSDVERATRRAAVLRKAVREPVIAAAVGDHVLPEASDAASRANVRVLIVEE